MRKIDSERDAANPAWRRNDKDKFDLVKMRAMAATVLLPRMVVFVFLILAEPAALLTIASTTFSLTKHWANVVKKIKLNLTADETKLGNIPPVKAAIKNQ